MKKIIITLAVIATVAASYTATNNAAKSTVVNTSTVADKADLGTGD